jgi:hypothetical protein
VGLLWAGGDNESGIADYEVAAMAWVAPDGSSDDGGTIIAYQSTHKQNYFRSIRVGAIDSVPYVYFAVQATNL